MKRKFSKFFVYVLVVLVFGSSAFAMHQLSPFRTEGPEPVVPGVYDMDKPEEQEHVVAQAGEQDLPPSEQLARNDTEEEAQKQEDAKDESNPAEIDTAGTTNSVAQVETNTTSQQAKAATSEKKEDNSKTEQKPAGGTDTATEEKPVEVVQEKQTPANPYRTSSSRDHRYMMKVPVKNTSENEAKNVRIEVPLVSSSSLYHTRRNESFSIEPSEIKTVSGTRVAVIPIGTLAPGEEVTVEIKTQVRTSNIEFFADYVPKDKSKSSSYLGASAGIESSNSQIINLSNQITQGLSTDWEKSQAITRWVANNISYNSSASNRNSGALQALQTRNGVCEDYAMLAAALARAANIPARIVYGYTDSGNKWPSSGSFSLSGYRHAWVEFSLEGRGWVPADPTRSNSSNLYFGRLQHNRYIIQNYSNISLKFNHSGGSLSLSWGHSLY